jgi:hypothetical protein
MLADKWIVENIWPYYSILRWYVIVENNWYLCMQQEPNWDLFHKTLCGSNYFSEFHNSWTFEAKAGAYTIEPPPVVHSKTVFFVLPANITLDCRYSAMTNLLWYKDNYSHKKFYCSSLIVYRYQKTRKFIKIVGTLVCNDSQGLWPLRTVLSPSEPAQIKSASPTNIRRDCDCKTH